MSSMTVELVPDSRTADIRQSATLLQRAHRVCGVNEFVKPIRNHVAIRGTELENDANVMHAVIRIQCGASLQSAPLLRKQCICLFLSWSVDTRKDRSADSQRKEYTPPCVRYYGQFLS